MAKMLELAKEVTSKNAGNFILTCDLVFDEPSVYERVKQSGVISVDTVARLYKIEKSQVLHVIAFDQGLAFKIAMRREHPSGDVGETDVFGAQQYTPLLTLEVP